MSVAPISVILVEDDDDLRESTREFLALTGYQVTAVSTGRGFYRALDEGQYVIAVIDIGLPDQSGLVLAEYLRANTTTGVIILTARDSEEDQLSGYESGADLYLTKPVASRVLGSAIARLAERLQGTPVDVQQQAEHPGVWILYREKWTILSPDGHSVALTSLEYRFIELLAQTEDRQIDREQLLPRLYQQSDDYTGRALDALVRRLRSKMTRMPVPANPIKSIYGVGYCFSEALILK